MLEMIKGVVYEQNNLLEEGYDSLDGQWIVATVHARNILPLFKEFIQVQESNHLFLFIEVPTNVKDEPLHGLRMIEGVATVEKLHKDVYYLDDCSKEFLLELLETEMVEVLIHDGLTNVGVGNLETKAEIGKYSYNEIKAYHPENSEQLVPVFEKMSITEKPGLRSPWEFITRDTPAQSFRYEIDGKDVYDVVEVLSSIGLYKAEMREE